MQSNFWQPIVLLKYIKCIACEKVTTELAENLWVRVIDTGQYTASIQWKF